MARRLPHVSVMRTLGLLLVALAIASSAVTAQETDAPQGALIEAAEVSGISLDRLSPGLREDIRALSGTTLDRGKLDALATRIEEEQPEVVAAVRAIARPNGDARVVFLVARISDDTSLVENINARYVVESVATSGVPDADVAQDLRDRLQALVGKPLRSEEADELSDELKAAFPRHEVKRRISRGTVRGRIRVVFELTRIERRSIPFSPLRSKFVYHEDQQWSGVLDVMVGNGIIEWAARSSLATTTTSSRNTPGSACASTAGSSPPTVSVRPSSSRGSPRTGTTPRLRRWRPTRAFPSRTARASPWSQP